MDTIDGSGKPKRDEAFEVAKSDAEWRAQLDDSQYRVLRHQATERPFTSPLNKEYRPGMFACAGCGTELFEATDKFDSGCGWPSFDDELPASVARHRDADGHRVEIVCAHCGGHLGHVFEGERLTEKNTRHCVNSISMKFIPEGQELPPVLGK